MRDAADGFELLGAPADETRLLLHRGRGFSLPIPGHASRVAVPAGPPAHDVAVAMADLAVEIGVRIDALPTAAEPAALAASLTQAYALARAAQVRRVAALRGRLLGEGFHAGANTIYQRRDTGPAPLMEHLQVLVRADDTTAWAVYVTTRYAAADLDVVRWAHLRSAMAGHERWEPAGPRTVAPLLWPAYSEFAELDARLRLLPAAQTEAHRKSRELGPLSEADAAAVVDELISAASGDEPPTAPVSEALIGAYCRRIAPRIPTRAGETLLRNTPAIRTFHDLRAWCWQGIVAVGHRPDQPDRGVN